MLEKKYALQSSNFRFIPPFIGMLETCNVEDVINAEKRGLLSGSKIDDIRSFEFERNKALIKLTDEEYQRWSESGLDADNIFYASENNDINGVFKTLAAQVDDDDFIATYILKETEKMILSSSLGDENKIRNICENLNNIKHVDVLYNCLSAFSQSKNDKIDIGFIAENFDDLYDSVHQGIKDYEDVNFFGGFYKMLSYVTPENIDNVKELTTLPGIRQTAFESATEYMYNSENIRNVSEITKRIKSGEDGLISLPAYKYAQLNPRVAEARGKELPEYDATVSKDEIAAKTKQGQIVASGDEVFIKDKDSLVKLGMNKDMYKKLFPEYKSLCLQQGENTGDCYFLSGGIISFTKNAKARVKLLQMFKQDGNDITVTIPGYKNYPVRFKNAEPDENRLHSDTSKGNLILEQAYAKAKYAYAHGIEDASTVNADKAMDYIARGMEAIVFNELTDDKKAVEYVCDDYKTSIRNAMKEMRPPEKKFFAGINFVSKERMKEMLDKYSDCDKYLLCAGSGFHEEGYMPAYGITPSHAYALEKIDTKNKTVTLINLYNSLYTSTISYDDFTNKFESLSVLEI